MPRHDAQQAASGPARAAASKAGLRARVRLGGQLDSLLGALILTMGLQALPTARAEDAGDAAVSGQVPPLAHEPAAGETAVEPAADGSPEPATVPQPPEQSSDDETLIELPIAPAASRQSDSDETGAPDGDASTGAAALPHDTEAPQSLRVLFPAADARLDAAAESELVRLAGYLSHHEAQRVVLRAHAADDGQGDSQARRLSLSRALAIRTFLVDRGVPAERIYLRPLGSASDEGPPDRVDILPLRP